MVDGLTPAGIGATGRTGNVPGAAGRGSAKTPLSPSAAPRDTVSLSSAAAASAPTAEEQLVQAMDQIRDLMLTYLHGKMQLSVSHGCIHIPTQGIALLRSFGAVRGTEIIFHPYSDTPPTPLPPVLIKGPAAKYRASNLRLEVFPGKRAGAAENGEVAIIYGRKDGKWQALGYFKVGCGPETEREASNRKSATPTPTGKFRITNYEVKSFSSAYYQTSIPGGADVRLDEQKGKAYYSIDQGKSWKPVTHPQLVKDLLDPEKRKTMTIPSKSQLFYIYAANDFTGQGHFEKGKQVPGMILKFGRTEYLHGGPSSDNNARDITNLTLKFLSEESVPLSPAELEKMFEGRLTAYLKIGRGEQLSLAEQAQIDSDPDLAGLSGIERVEAIETMAMKAYNQLVLSQYLSALAPLKNALIEQAQTAGRIYSVLDMAYLASPEDVLRDILTKDLPKGAAVSLLKAKQDNAVPPEFALPASGCYLSVFAQEEKVYGLDIVITKGEHESPKEFAERVKRAFNEAKKVLPPSMRNLTRELRLPPQALIAEVPPGTTEYLPIYEKL